MTENCSVCQVLLGIFIILGGHDISPCKAETVFLQSSSFQFFTFPQPSMTDILLSPRVYSDSRYLV